MTVNPTLGRTIKMFLVDGHVDGLVTAEVINWTGHIISIPRPLLPRLAQRDERDRTGVYILVGEENGRRVAYIGETDEMFTRLSSHARDERMAFFTRIIVVTSTSDTLTKAHVRRLESLLAQKARAAGSYEIRGNKPYDAKLPESDTEDMKWFCAQIELVLPTIGVDVLQTPRTPEQVKESGGEQVEYEIVSAKHGIRATAREDGGQFIVLAGSLANVKSGAKHSYAAARRALEESGKLVAIEDDPDHMRFVEDIGFSSPSAAAAAVFSRSSNGREAWRVKGSGMTYAEHEVQRLA